MKKHADNGISHFFMVTMVYALCSAASGADSTNRLFVTGRIEGDARHTFWANWANLPSKVTWEPGVQGFPADLSAKWNRMKSHMIATNRTIERLALARITIERLFVPERQLRVHGFSPGDLANQWYLGFSWTNRSRSSGQPAYSSGSAFILLDGALLQEEVRDLKSSLPNIGGNGSNLPGRARSSSADGSRGVGWTDSQIIKPNVSAILWEPGSESFPMDLNDAFKLAKTHADQDENDADNRILSKIWITEYFPSRLLLGGGQSSRGHWKVSFFFTHPSRPRDDVCIVDMLLDQQIISVFRDRRSQEGLPQRKGGSP